MQFTTALLALAATANAAALRTRDAAGSVFHITDFSVTGSAGSQLMSYSFQVELTQYDQVLFSNCSYSNSVSASSSCNGAPVPGAVISVPCNTPGFNFSMTAMQKDATNPPEDGWNFAVAWHNDNGFHTQGCTFFEQSELKCIRASSSAHPMTYNRLETSSAFNMTGSNMTECIYA